MRIGTRITLSASLLVAVTLGVYGVVSLRSSRADREADLTRQAREMAAAVRATVETRGFLESLQDSYELKLAFARTGTPWSLELLDARDAPPAHAPPSADPRGERLRRVLAIKGPLLQEGTDAGRPVLIYLEPILEAAPLLPDGVRVVGVIELSRDRTFLGAVMADESWRMFASMAVLIGILSGVILFVARKGISKPIAKLLAGIDDVAKGDLSRVLLQERDDEIGTLAARFNEMTASLREARAEIRRSTEQLRRTDKLATIGRVAAEIAHEVGTPLNVVTGRARAMAKKADDPEAVAKNASIIAEQATRIARIIQRLLDYARRRFGDTERTAVDINRLARETLEFLEHQLEHGRIELRLSLDEQLPRVPADHDQLQQVFLNLYINAIQAMTEGGSLEVGTGRVRRGRPGLTVAPDQDYALMTVADTGAGIAEADRERVFEAFYTSKIDEGGTGLGLAVAHGIVGDHDGWIEVGDNEAAGHGAIFRVFLPLAEAQSDSPDALGKTGSMGDQS